MHYQHRYITARASSPKLCVCVRAREWGGGEGVGGVQCVCWRVLTCLFVYIKCDECAYLNAFLSALGSCEMGRLKKVFVMIIMPSNSCALIHGSCGRRN